MKIVIIGAGSRFGAVLSNDILLRPEIRDCQLVLCDIDQGRLDEIYDLVMEKVEKNRLATRVDKALYYQDVLADADFVITSISVGGGAYWGEPYISEINIPRKYGIEQSVADTLNPGGVFRFLRTAPVQLDICRKMEKLCPDALLMNYTNPMAMLTWLHSQASGIRNVGLCHSVQNTVKELASYLGEDPNTLTFKAGGINHQSWILELKKDGKDMYPRLFEKIKVAEIYNSDNIRFEILKNFGCFVTESSKHNSEYSPYFRRSEELRKKYKLLLKQARMEKGKPAWLKESVSTAEGEIKDLDLLEQSHEFASGIIEGIVTDEVYHFYGNVMNEGLIDNLPDDSCVETECVANKNGIQPVPLGRLPGQLAGLNLNSVNVIRLAVEAFLEKDREKAFYACALDPLTAASADLDQIRLMFEELWEQERELLAYFN